MNEGNHDPVIHRIMSGDARGIWPAAVRGLCRCAAPVYAGAVQCRNAMFDRGWRKVVSLPVPVISVGNITAGGTGKTPMVIALARQLRELGHHPAVLLRGYKAAREDVAPTTDASKPAPTSAGTVAVSDEATELRDALGEHVPVQADADRVAAAYQVLQAHPHVDVFLLDDGFQHRRVHRTWDIVLIDATNPFGFGHLLPRGLLREPLRNLRRADTIILTRADMISQAQREQLTERIIEHHGHPPLAGTAHQWQALRRGDVHLAVDQLRDQPIAVICGIGNPQALIATARRHGMRIVYQMLLDDHHHYLADELSRWHQQATAAGALSVLTTEKDWVKCQPLMSRITRPLPVVRPQLTVHWLEGETAVLDYLKKLFPTT